MSVEDFNSYEETAYLMASPLNAERLNQAIQEVEIGNFEQHELIDDFILGRKSVGRLSLLAAG